MKGKRPSKEQKATGQTREAVLVSACLLGLATRYDGQNKSYQTVLDYLRDKQLLAIPICPEQLAGLATPREKCYFQSGNGHDALAGSGRIISESGQIMTEAFCRGARMTLQIARLSDCQQAILKERSPSCGVNEIYLGNERVPGSGVTSTLLKESGFDVLSEEDI